MFGEDENKKPGIELEYKFDSVIEFYKQAINLEETGNKPQFEEHLKARNKGFIGADLIEIHDSKYKSTRGMDIFKKMKPLEINLGGKRVEYKYDEEDGDEMNYERFLEEKAFLQKRINTIGSKKGKFINIFINIGENAFVSHEEILWKAISTIKIVDELEKQNYRTSVTIFSKSAWPGSFKGQDIDLLYVYIKIKRPEDPLNIPLLLTTVSPWMLRYWLFCFWCAKLNTDYGLGQARPMGIKSTKENIYIDNGECLSEKAYEEKIKELKDLGLKL